ncbi:MAG: hypothetical protein Q4G03_10515 [Planctomycetia bacterium]|nr:hypothetical protein [Planctomycetia bacterium]
MNVSHKSFAIIGASESGKSHYITALINELQRQSTVYNWSLGAVDDITSEFYYRQLYAPLYEQKVPLRKTQVEREARELRYRLTLRNTEVYLNFYDVAGETFSSEAQMQARAAYIKSSAGIIFIVDPLQMRSVRLALMDEDRRRPGATPLLLPQEATGEESLKEIFRRTVNMLNSSLDEQGKIKKPLAVTFTKFDALRALLGDDAPVFLPSRHRKGRFSIADSNRIHDYLETFLSVYDADDEVRPHAQRFRDHAYFGVSALGMSTDRRDEGVQVKGDKDSADANSAPTADAHAVSSEKQRLKAAPRPIRVLDPFLWLLHKNGLLPECDNQNVKVKYNSTIVK